MKTGACGKDVWLPCVVLLSTSVMPPPNKWANARPLPFDVNQWLCAFFCGSKSAAREEKMGTLMSFSSWATSQCCLFDSQPSLLVFESQGGSISYPCWEKKGNLVYLKEHAGLRGLFPQRGGYESECQSDSPQSHTTSASACCQEAPSLTPSPLPPFLSS